MRGSRVGASTLLSGRSHRYKQTGPPLSPENSTFAHQIFGHFALIANALNYKQ
jgi:hypothetical protein